MKKLRAREFQTTPRFSQADLKNKTDQQLCDDIEMLICSSKRLTFIPELKNCTHLVCYNNSLTLLPRLEKCRDLDCFQNKLTSLPKLKRCTQLDCSYNQLTSLPELKRCRKLWCNGNLLTSLPALNRCTKLQCKYNLLFSEELRYWRLISKLKKKIANKKIANGFNNYTKFRQALLQQRHDPTSLLSLLPLDILEMCL
jgi:hypothetical protein